MRMNKKKSLYEVPTTDVLVVRFEGNLLAISNGVNYSDTIGGAGGNDVFDDDDLF